MYTLAEVAEHFQVDKRTVYRWMKAGKLQGVKPSRQLYFSESALARFVLSQEYKFEGNGRGC